MFHPEHLQFGIVPKLSRIIRSRTIHSKETRLVSRIVKYYVALYSSLQIILVVDGHRFKADELHRELHGLEEFYGVHHDDTKWIFVPVVREFLPMIVTKQFHSLSYWF